MGVYIGYDFVMLANASIGRDITWHNKRKDPKTFGLDRIKNLVCACLYIYILFIRLMVL